MRLPALLLGLCCLLHGRSADADSRAVRHPVAAINEHLRRVLVEMGRADQAAAKAALAGSDAPDDPDTRIKMLEQIVAEYGWPGRSLVGSDGAEAAWIVAQHADTDLAFQEQCLTLVQKAYENGEVTGMQLAYLTDRVLVAQHRPQRFGTQGASLYSKAETAEIDARRKKLGLPSMAEMARTRGQEYERLRH
jgi:hypothetical protein